MSRRTILILLGILILALGAWVFVQSRKAAKIEQETGKKPGFVETFFPFAVPGVNAPKPDGSTEPGQGGETPGSEIPAAERRLMQVTDKPVAGYVIVLPPPAPKTAAKKPAAKTTVATAATIATAPTIATGPTYPTVRFMERGTGYLYDTDAKAVKLTKASGTVISRAARAIFLNNGANVAVQYVKTDNTTVATFVGAYVPPATGSTIGEVKGSFLPDGVLDIVPSADGKSLVALMPAGSGSAVFSMQADGSGRKQLLSSPFMEWLLDQTSGGTVVTSKAASGVPGYAYFIRANNVLEKILGNIDALTTKLSPDGKYMLYGSSAAGKPSLTAYSLKDRARKATGLATLPEKCVWAANSLAAYCAAPIDPGTATYPDDWYQGSAHFNDRIWKVDPKTGTTTELSDGEGNFLDAVNLALDKDQKFLLLVNKNDGTLWSLDLSPKPVQTETPALPQV